jgi:hypothetical protein
MSHDAKTVLVDIILTAITGVTGVASTLDNVEQLGRILLLFISICSGMLLILVNWKKGMTQLKEWFK